MNQAERLIQVRVSEKTIEAANRELAQLYKVRTNGEKLLAIKDIDADTRAKAETEMETLKATISDIEDRRHQARRWIEKMKSESADEGMVTVINERDSRAEIVIHYAAEGGKKLSYTRHVHYEGGRWMGISTVSSGQVAYRLSGAPSIKAA